MIWNVKPRLAPPVTRSRRKITVVSAATTSTTNITGFLIISRGSSLTKDEAIAGITIFGSSIAETGTRFCNFMVSMDVTPNDRLEQGVGVASEVLDDRAERERREEGEAADDQDDADDEADEQAARRWQSPGRRRNRFLGCQRSRQRHRRHDHEEAAEEHRTGPCEIVEEGVACEATERRAVVAGLRGEGIEHLGEAVRTGVGHRRHCRRHYNSYRGPTEIEQRQYEHGQHRHLDFPRLDFLADIFRRAANHQTRHEDRDDDDDQHAVET